MTSVDDMVLTPTVGDVAQPAARQRAKALRRMYGAARKKATLSRIMQFQALRRIVRRQRYGKALDNAGKLARKGAGAVTGGRVGRATTALNPVTIAVAGLVVASVAALRLGTGQSFGNMGAQVNNMLLGDLDDEARAAMDVRNQLSGDADIARIVGKEGKVNAQIRSVAGDLRRLATERQKGLSVFREDTTFQVNNILDQLILRARDKFKQSFGSSGGGAALDKLQRKYSEVTQIAAGGTSR